MQTATLTIFRVNHSPVRMQTMELGQCLRMLLPYLHCCCRSGRASEEVASLELSDGKTIRFACREGAVQVTRQVPLINKSRHPFLGNLPIPMRLRTERCSDEAQLNHWVKEELSGDFGGEAFQPAASW